MCTVELLRSLWWDCRLPSSAGPRACRPAPPGPSPRARTRAWWFSLPGVPGFSLPRARGGEGGGTRPGGPEPARGSRPAAPAAPPGRRPAHRRLNRKRCTHLGGRSRLRGRYPVRPRGASRAPSLVWRRIWRSAVRVLYRLPAVVASGGTVSPGVRRKRGSRAAQNADYGRAFRCPRPTRKAHDEMFRAGRRAC